MPPRVIFVCTGNLNRSAAAEVVAEVYGLDATSAGVSATPGRVMAKRMRDTLIERGYDPTRHRTRRWESPEPDDALVIGFQPSHLRAIPYARSLIEFIPGATMTKVPDPHFDSTGRLHRLVLDLIEEAMPTIVETVS